MKVDIKVPSVGESVVEATISQILQPSGSLVQQDQEIIELETEKVNQVLYAPKAGKITLSVKVGDVVKVGQTIGEIDTDVTVPTIVAPPKPVEAGPSIRKMAPEYIAELKEPSPPKAVVKEVTPSSDKMVRKKMTSLRRTISARLVEAKNSTAMLTTFNEVDMGTILDLRAKEQEAFVKKYGVKLGFMSFFIKACVSGLKAYPAVNSMIDGEDVVTIYTYDIGVAVSTERGLLVPVVRNADQLSFGEIEQTLAELAKKAREGKISMDELRGGSFTISNGGIFGSLLSTPILNPPQSGVLGMHAITKRPIALEDKVVIRPMMYLALSYDHRVIDGKEAIQFLGHLKESLEDPAKYASQI